jgi:hypothetical protein
MGGGRLHTRVSCGWQGRVKSTEIHDKKIKKAGMGTASLCALVGVEAGIGFLCIRSDEVPY